MENNILIRKGKKSDLPGIFDLIKELAKYEKAENEVSNSILSMEDDGFGENPIYFFFVAESIEKNIIGMALYYFKYSTWKGRCLFLEDIIVNSEYRGLGIGKALFQKVIHQAKNEKVKRLEFQVLNWNQTAIDFYKKFDCNFDDEWINVKLTEDQILHYQT